MLIQGFGIKLHALSHHHLDILRDWRNSDFVQAFMQQRVAITPESQQEWFKTLDKEKNHYFIIESNGVLVGCCNIKNIDEDGVGEGGVFLCAAEFLNGMLASKAVFLMYDWAFKNKLIRSAKSEILLDNKRAIRFNKMLGFSIDVNESIVKGFLTENAFYNQYNRFYKTLNQ
ncbi:GNAT family N-acetyltransferase [Shewanella sp. SM21]|uniref:GNAT family N-acetyltransferase n=1 Tax=Shewanella sp. SM21 TaxID=2912793 RepID=UPI0021DB3DB9|nr:GNAT family N-acetyltransferase [Shewanella sp. SM21]MCU8088320.1 GNAT family N-acetyltransferase [Shewanella sp. SM21]